MKKCLSLFLFSFLFGLCWGCGVQTQQSQQSQRGLSPDGLSQATESQNKRSPVRETEPSQRIEKTKKPKGYSLGHSCSGAFACRTRICHDFTGLGAKSCSKRCSFHSDCPRGFRCENHRGAKEGFCIPSCRKDSDCASFASLSRCTIEGHCWDY